MRHRWWMWLAGAAVLLLIVGYGYVRENSCNWWSDPHPIHGEKDCSSIVF